MHKTFNYLTLVSSLKRDATSQVSFYELDMTASNATTLEKRVDVKACFKKENAGHCIAILGIGATVALGIPPIVKSYSDNHDCRPHTGNIDGVYFKFYATGRNCDTTAQTDTIRGALYEFIEGTGQKDQMCGTYCIKLTHKGTYAGYLMIGGDQGEVNNEYCGSKENFTVCRSGGKNTAQP
ncbi:uncharacterized protein JCM15063_004668 [Sporobolomyces koalae]|uniref:uncharacterized protein n=1 Tax=Sporobolomyces koalae TaxID=500713 RepID=UPI0031720D3F